MSKPTSRRLALPIVIALLALGALTLLPSRAAEAPAPYDPVVKAEAEARHRQALLAVLTSLLNEAEQFRKVQSWTNAVGRYEAAVGHAKLLGGVETVEKQYRDALAGLTHCRIQLAVALQEKLQFKAAAEEVDKVLPFEPNSPQVAEFKKFNERVEAARPGPLPRPTAGELLVDRAKIRNLVRDGKLYFEVGQYHEARPRLMESIVLDPLNEAAFFYLRLVDEAEFTRAIRLREGSYVPPVVEVMRSRSAQAKTALPVLNPYYRTNSVVPFLTHSSKGAQRINRKLEEIVLPEVHFDGVPLAEVVKRLAEDARKFDPEPDPKQKGVNFLINDVVRSAPPLDANGNPLPVAPLLDASGNPVPPAQPVPLSEGLIRISTQVRHLTLRQALDVICKTAELPTQFSVEEYAVAFIPRGPVAYYARTFRVNPDTFMQGLRGVVTTPVIGVTTGGNAAGGAGQNQPTTTPVRATIPATVPTTQRTAADANALVRQFFLSAGVTGLGATNSATQVQFNPQTGALVVRATTNELRVIEQALGKLSSSPPAQK